MNAKLIQSMPLLKEKFLISLIRDGASNTSLLSEKLNMLEIPLSVEGRYLVAVISIDDDHADKLSSMAEREKQLRSFAVLNICQELIMRHLDGVAFENRNGEFICLLRLASEELDDQLYAIFTEMKQTLKTLLKISVTVGVGQTVHSLGQLPVSYQAASQASSLKLFLGKNQIITVDSLDSSSTHSFKLTGSILEKCASLLKAGDDTLVEQFVRELFAQLTGYRTASLRYCQNVCMQLILTGSGLLFELDMHNEEWANRELAVSEQLLHLETIDDLQSVTIDYFTKLSEGIRSKRDKQSNVVVERVKQYIEQNYHEDITINGIAKHVYLTSTYVCLLFKQETGETIKDYVTTFRMEKAKELLTDLQYKLYTISTAVGYNDSSYFSKIFKKHTGLTPSEYRGKSQ
jgi:two-component system response regulator YesN